MTAHFALLQPDRAGYPQQLASLGWDKPLYLRGVLGTGPSVAIVGARAATARGMDRAHLVASHLARRHIHVVSGGALGIDGAAHRGALAGAGTTTVVLGSGIDVAYPVRHHALFAEVVARGGGLVSLLPPGTQPRHFTFLQRNPLIAALADAVIVIEADVRSGSLSTARACRELGRMVAAWPGSRGCDRLLARGAAVVEDVADVDRVIAGAPRFRELALDPIPARVAEALVAGARGVDELVRQTGLTVREVLRALPLIEDSCSARKP